MADGICNDDIVVRDVAGRVIAKPRAWPIDERRAMVNLAGLPAGVYFLELKSEEALLRARLVRR